MEVTCSDNFDPSSNHQSYCSYFSFWQKNIIIGLLFKNMAWIRLNMDDTLLDSLGLIASYKDDLDKIIDLETIGNEFIDNCKNNNCA